LGNLVVDPVLRTCRPIAGERSGAPDQKLDRFLFFLQVLSRLAGNDPSRRRLPQMGIAMPDTEDPKEKYLLDHVTNYVVPHFENREKALNAWHFFRSSSFSGHHIRFLETYRRLLPYLKNDQQVIAEAGHLSGLSRYLASEGMPVRGLTGDFRYSINAENECCDLLLCLEVIEHIKDQNSDVLKEIVLWNNSGINAFFSEMSRVLRPNGHLVVTTPNASSLRTIHQALSGSAPFVYRPHVREYTIKELVDLATPHGFELVESSTMYCFFFLHNPEARLKKYIGDLGFDMSNRGDDLFLVLKRNP
jgi:SAM-dependent methyltransferase